jgi:hypothetical protein
MTIEPAPMPEESVAPPAAAKPAGRIPVVEDQTSDLWIPPPKDENDLSVPPRILTTPKRLPHAPVEDILAETEHNDLMQFEHPDLTRTQMSAHSGFFRKLGIGFALVALAVLVFVGYITYAHATIIIYPKLVETKIERSIDVVAQPGATSVGGETAEVTVSGEQSAVPGSASSTAPTPVVAPAPAPAADANATYVGVATLTNKTASPITLVPTTRLLSSDGILFRMKDRQTVPAGGTAKVSVYADKPGSTGALGPSKFTIPGLPTDQQALIYAETKSAMTTGGSSSAPTAAIIPAAVPQVAVTQVDLDNLESGLTDQLVTEAKAELAKKITGTWTGQAWIVEKMSRSPEPAVGDLVSQIDLKLTIRVRQVSFDRQKAIDLATAEIKRQLHSDQEFVGIQDNSVSITADQIDTQSGSATLHLALTGDSSISLGSPLIDAEKLQGLSLSAVKDYFTGVQGVDRIDVQFRPFWIKRMPDLKEHIEFQLAK